MSFQYIDTCSNNGYDYADLFAEDGFFAPFQNGASFSLTPVDETYTRSIQCREGGEHGTTR